MAHHTKDKGDLAAIKTISTLVSKGFVIFTPLVCEHLPFDVAGYKDGKFLRFQSKYRSGGEVSNKTVWTDKHGIHVKEYSSSDFDYYAIYLPDKDVVCFPSISFGGIKLCTTLPNSATPFYWYEDFLDLTDKAEKKTYHDFGYELTSSIIGSREPRYNARKVIRPTKDELNELIWSKPTTIIAKQFGVSDKAIEKWVKSYELTKPPRGYWQKLKSNE